MWSIKLTYGYNLWLIVSSKWIIQEKGFVSFRQIFLVLFHPALTHSSVWRDMASYMQSVWPRIEYTRSSLKAVKRQHLGGFSLAKITIILCLPMNCTKTLYVTVIGDRFPERPHNIVHNCKRVKKLKQWLAEGTKNSVVCNLKSQRFASVFSVAGHKLWTTHLEQMSVLRFGSLNWTESI